MEHEVPEDWDSSVPPDASDSPRLDVKGGGDPWQHGDDPWTSGHKGKWNGKKYPEGRPSKPTKEVFDAFYQWWNDQSVESAETQSAPPGVGGSGASGADSAADRVKPGGGRRTRQRTSGTEQDGDRRGYGRPRDDPPGEPGGDGFGQGQGDDHGGRRGQAPKKPHRSGGPGGDDDGPPSDDPGRSGGGSADSSSARTSEIESLLRRRSQHQHQQYERPKSSLGSVKIEDFYGDRQRYQAWRRVVFAQQQLYRLESAELAMLIYISCKKEARDVLDQMTIDEMVAPEGLREVWRLLDEAYHETSEEHFERVEGEFNSYRRLPGQSIASYLSQIKRLKMEYQREDPGTRMSDRAWAQRILARASLSKRERMDVFFSSGGFYVSKEVERALRHRCQRIHEEERRVPGFMRRSPQSRPSLRSTSSTASTASTTSSSTRTRSRRSYLASVPEDGEEEMQGAEDENEDEDLEKEAGAYEAFVQDRGEEEDEEEEQFEDGEASEDEALTVDELKEAWAAGWRAKDQVAEKKKNRNFRGGGGPRKGHPGKKGSDARKTDTTCSSCGLRGHWRGDPECPKVKSGEDKPFQPKVKPPKTAHFVGVSGVSQENITKRSVGVSDPSTGLKVHEVNFTFMVGGRLAGRDGMETKRREVAAASKPTCPRCNKEVTPKDKFCSECGSSLALHPMKDQEKRGWKLVDYSSGEEDEVYSSPGRHLESSCSFCGKSGHWHGDCPKLITKAAAAKAAVRSGYVPDKEDLKDMNKDEKKQLLRQLRAEVQDEPRPAGEVSTAIAPGRKNTTLRPPTDELPNAMKKQQLEEFRRALFEERVDRKGRLHPSEAAEFKNEEQRKCPHPWSRLRWSANGQGHFARCRACDLKNCLYWHERHGSFMVKEDSGAHDGGQDFLPKNSILAIGDSGCRTAVGGEQWHVRFQTALRQLGMSWTEVAEEEWFKFGAGEPEKSVKAYIYPVGIHGVCSYLRMSEVKGEASDCPGLVGPSDMSRWKVTFRFGDKQVDAMGSSRPMILTSTRHPGLNLLEFGDKRAFHQQPLQVLHDQLRQHPQLFAFISKEIEDEAGTGTETGASEESEACESWTESEDEAEVQELLEDLERSNLPLRNYEAESEEEAESDDSTTSHEFGVTWAEDSPSDIEEVENDVKCSETWFSCLGAMATFSKGKKRKVRSHVKEIQAAMVSRPSIPRSVPRPTPTKPVRPFKVLEVFTWTMAITLVAVARGWQGQEPVTLPRWDLRQASDRAAAYQYLVREEPDLLVLAWPCTVWSPLQHLGPMSEERLERLVQRQQADRDCFLSLVHDMVQFQRSRGRAHLGENPLTSRAWKEPLIQAAYDGEVAARCDMCCYGLRRPDTKQKLMKPTKLAGTPEIVLGCARRCARQEPHAHTLGTFKFRGKTQSVASFAGGYTKSFAKEVVCHAERFLDEWTPEAVTVYGVEETVAEEKFSLPEEEAAEVEEADWRMEEQHEVSPEDVWGPGDGGGAARETVVKIYQRLGHPARATLLRMLKLAGAPKETIEEAKTFQCPVCQSKAPPDKPYLQNPRARPAGFNVEVHVDLKYGKNIKDETFVALSVVCAGTNKHMAVMLKTRKASYVARKFIKHWIAVFGRPERIVMDQGGEFERDWILMLEQYGIFSTTTGSHAGWQHALAERHGGLLGITWHALVVNFRVVSRADMALSLAAAVEAKNETVTRRGYSPNMLVFGKSIHYPELLGEEQFDQVTMSQALDTESEMARRSKMRMHARQVLLRDDVQQKLKRALLRRPATQEVDFMPGQVIYFFIPTVGKARYRHDHGRWRGPAVVIMKESHQRYYVSWRGRCLLLAAPNMRLASQEESMSHGWIRDEMDDLAGKMQDEGGNGKDYEDCSQVEPPPIPKPSEKVDDEAKRMMSGMRTVRKLMAIPRLQDQKRQLGISDRSLRDQSRPPRPPKRLKALEDGTVGSWDQGSTQHRPQPTSTSPQPLASVPHQPSSTPYLPTSQHRQPSLVQPRPSSLPRPSTAPQRGVQTPRRARMESDMEDLSHEQRVEDEEQEEEAEEDEEAFWRKVMEDEDRYIEEDEQQKKARRSQLLDDVPVSMKRGLDTRGEEKDVSKKVRSDFFTMVMVAASRYDLQKEEEVEGRRSNEWLAREELRVLQRLLDLPVRAARVHFAPRKRLQRPPNDKPRRRVSVLLGQEPGMALLVQEEAHEVQNKPRRRAPFLWRGLTVFVAEEEEPRKKEHSETVEVYVQEGGVMYGIPWKEADLDLWCSFVRLEQAKMLACETYLLRMKENGKELDPRSFDEQEWKHFREADQKEWLSWVKNKVVRVVPRQEAQRVPVHKIFRIPLRWIRTNKNKELDYMARVVAKSRLVVPGHADPGLGDYRTDAPTTNPVSVRFIKSLAASRNWIVKIFDVSTAFLSGNPTDREVYVKAPSDGLPATDTTDAIQPYAVLQILKSAYGLAEAPRLWYLRAAALLEECSLVEVPFSRATFLRSEGGVTKVACALHVDDGILAGDPKSPEFVDVMKKINARFNIKEWQTLDEGGVDFLGCRVMRRGNHIVDSMKTYVEKIEPMKTTSGEEPLDTTSRTAYRRLVMQLRWPSQHVLPEKLFSVSQLAQQVTTATMKQGRDANKVLAEFKKLAKEGLMEVKYQPLVGEPAMISFFDASLGKSTSTRAQQGQVHFVTTDKAHQVPTPANLVEFRSSKITRVVKSSLAAEGSSLSTASDEQLYLRLLCETIWYGAPDLTGDWKAKLRVSGTLVTDAKALYDHLVKTGYMTAERQTMLDILAAKQLVESSKVAIAWVPTFRQVADGLTKDMPDELFLQFKRQGLLSLKETDQDKKIEAHRSSLRKAQRERRKLRMQVQKGQTTPTLPLSNMEKL